jgi:predicted ArsR family transcriptional regulator
MHHIALASKTEMREEEDGLTSDEAEATAMQHGQLEELDRTVSALQDATRRRILFDFYVHNPEWTADEVGRAVGVHRTVAHRHLERLVALGYLTVAPRRGRAGKPAKLYRLAGKRIDVNYPVRRFARLAALLAESVLDQGTEAVAAARATGRRYGASMVTAPASTVEQALQRLAPLGCDYVVIDPDMILARNCIFREACALAAAVVCELHAGILEGAIQRTGVDARAEAMLDFARFGCAYRLVVP